MTNKNNEFFKVLNDIKGNLDGVNIRELNCSGTKLFILNIPQMCDRDSVSINIIKPLMMWRGTPTVENLTKEVLFSDFLYTEVDPSQITQYVLRGFTIIIGEGFQKYIVINTIKIEKRSVTPPEVHSTLKGPRDSFNENVETNLSLLRYRLKDKNLAVESYTVRSRTKTGLAVLYLKDMADMSIVDSVVKKIQSIKVDGILESGYVQKLLSDDVKGIFPRSIITERPDSVSASILKGKIAIIVEGSNLVIILPAAFIDFIDSGDDHYDNLYLAVFLKIIRIVSIGLFVFMSSLYIVVVGFNPDFLPHNYVIFLANTRLGIPFNVVIEVITMEIAVEIIREASVRLPRQIGPAIGILGTLIVGEAAVSAGIVSQMTIIVIGLTAVASFIVVDQSLGQALRIVKYLIIALTATFGLLGFTLAFIVFMVMLLAVDSVDESFMYPFAPLNSKQLFLSFFTDIRLRNKKAPPK